MLPCLYTLHSTKKWARHPLTTGSANFRMMYTQSKGHKTQNHICQTKELNTSECSCYKLDIREHFQLISTHTLILQMHSSPRLPTLFSPTPSTLNSFCLPCLSSFWNTCLNNLNHLLWSWIVVLYSSPTDFMSMRYTVNWNSHQNRYSHASSIEHKRTAHKFFNSCELTLKFIIRANCKEQLGVNKSTC